MARIGGEGDYLSVSPTRIVGLRLHRVALQLEQVAQPFSIPYSDRWVEAVDCTATAGTKLLILSVSPTRIVGLRRTRSLSKQGSSPTFSIPYSDRWVEACSTQAATSFACSAFSIPYSDRWVEAHGCPTLPVGNIALSVSPTRIVGLRRDWGGVADHPGTGLSVSPTRIVGLRQRGAGIAAADAGLGHDFQYPLLGSLG